MTNDPMTDSPKITPWLELNDRRTPAVEACRGLAEGTAGGLTTGEYAMLGLRHWARVTDQALITTSPGGLPGLYEFVSAGRPAGLRIVGGIKTYSLPGCVPRDPRPWDFADAAGWTGIAQQARQIADVTGNRTVLLENETTLLPFWSGAEVDLDRLRRSLVALLVTGIRFIWYHPSIVVNRVDERIETRTRALVETIRDILPDSLWITDLLGYPDSGHNDRLELLKRQRMVETLGADRLIDYLHVTSAGTLTYENGTTRACYAPDTAAAALAALPASGGPVGIYTGLANWVAVGRAFAGQKTGGGS